MVLGVTKNSVRDTDRLVTSKKHTIHPTSKKDTSVKYLPIFCGFCRLLNLAKAKLCGKVMILIVAFPYKWGTKR